MEMDGKTADAVEYGWNEWMKAVPMEKNALAFDENFWPFLIQGDQLTIEQSDAFYFFFRLCKYLSIECIRSSIRSKSIIEE